MRHDKGCDSPDRDYSQGIHRLIRNVNDVLEIPRDPDETFLQFTKSLETEYDIRKGLLALRDTDHVRFLIVATFNQRKVRKNLSLKLPLTSSLFEKVAEHGRIHTESFTELFDGNSIERRLLLDDSSRSFMLRPLKHEGQVFALLGYSSENPDAFVMFEEGLLDPIIDRFAAAIAGCQLAQSALHR